MILEFPVLAIQGCSLLSSVITAKACILIDKICFKVNSIPIHILAPCPQGRLVKDLVDIPSSSSSLLSHLSGRYSSGFLNSAGSRPIPNRFACTWVYNTRLYRYYCCLRITESQVHSYLFFLGLCLVGSQTLYSPLRERGNLQVLNLELWSGSSQMLLDTTWKEDVSYFVDSVRINGELYNGVINLKFLYRYRT